MAQARAIRTRQAVLDAARAAFARDGFDGARVDHIARTAGANKQRIYAYFGSKARLFAAVQSEAMAALAACEAGLLPAIEADPRQMGSLLLTSYLRFHDEHPDFWRLLAWSNLGTIAPSSRPDARTPVLRRLAAVFARAQKAGGAPVGISFASWFVTLTAVVVFLFANQRTARASLGLDLGDARTRARLARDVLALIGPRGS